MNHSGTFLKFLYLKCVKLYINYLLKGTYSESCVCLEIEVYFENSPSVNKSESLDREKSVCLGES